MLGASTTELGLVALLLGIVLLSAKISKIGETLGAFFAGSSAREGDTSRQEKDGQR
jgi:hypothetical protein